MTIHDEVNPGRMKKLTGLELAEIETLILLKKVGREDLLRILDAKQVGRPQELDPLTARNLLYYLRSL